jgi:predicted permease
MFGLAPDLILNIAAGSSGDMQNRERRFLMGVGRLRPDISRGQANAEVRGLWSQLATEYPKADKELTVHVAPVTILSPEDMQTARLISEVMVACSLLILLIACANTANLLLALATLRRQEALIKTALGAERGRLIREFLQETAVVCGIGGAFGYGIAILALRRLSHIDLNLPTIGLIPVAADLHPGLLVVVLTLALIVIASLASGLAPALYASKPNLAAALTGEIAVGGTRRGWMRAIVVAVQVAVCTLVLAGTGLCWRSLENLRHVDTGFSARNIAAVLAFPEAETTPENGLRIGAEIRRSLMALHGIESVALVDELPLGGGNGNRDDVHFTDRPDDPERKNIIKFGVVDENYFTTLGIRVLEGRVFRASDGPGAPEVVVINRLMANKYWPHQSAIGRTIRIAGSKKETATIIGVVADGKYEDIEEDPQPYLYHAFAQHVPGVITVIVRTAGDPRQWLQPMLTAIKKLDVALPLPPTTMDSWMNLALFAPLLTLGCVSAISLLALLLATSGLYGAVSYSVSDRRRELGIRIALGARPSQIMRMVFRQTLWLAGIGVAAGLALSIGAASLLGDQFYRLNAVEWTVLLPIGAAMIGVSLAIAFGAARRWTRMNPMDAVRHI